MNFGKSSALEDESEFLKGSRLDLNEDKSIRIMQTNMNTNVDLQNIDTVGSQSTA